MKTNLFVLLSFLYMNSFCQNLYYDIHGIYKRPVKKEILHSAKFVKDVISGYPVNWITSYDSVEVSSIFNGKSMKAVSRNDTLSNDQKSLLASMDLTADLTIDVHYKYRVPVTRVMENNTMHVPMTVVPESEAEYTGGHQQLMQYVNKNGISKISKKTSKKLQQAIIRFTVNEEGDIMQATLIHTSGNRKTDKRLLRMIQRMPKWKAAESSNNIKVKQEFEFTLGRGGC